MLLQCVRTDSINASDVRVMGRSLKRAYCSGSRRSQFCTMTPGAEELGLGATDHRLHGYSVALIANIVVIDTVVISTSASPARRRGQSRCRSRLRVRRGRANTHLSVLTEKRIRAHGLFFSVNDFGQTGVPTPADRIQRIPLGSLSRTFRNTIIQL
jgi:hypothetical protein